MKLFNGCNSSELYYTKMWIILGSFLGREWRDCLLLQYTRITACIFNKLLLYQPNYWWHYPHCQSTWGPQHSPISGKNMMVYITIYKLFKCRRHCHQQEIPSWYLGIYYFKQRKYNMSWNFSNILVACSSQRQGGPK